MQWPYPQGGVSIANLEPDGMNFELGRRADHQKQEDAHQRRIWVRTVLLRLILHDRSKMRGISYTGLRV